MGLFILWQEFWSHGTLVFFIFASHITLIYFERHLSEIVERSSLRETAGVFSRQDSCQIKTALSTQRVIDDVNHGTIIILLALRAVTYIFFILSNPLL